ncbi:hypothetical protein BH11BAC3_BH11BAC3_05940 [soil metagenome]
MKYKILQQLAIIFSLVFLSVADSTAQPIVHFSETIHFSGQPFILGQTEKNYFCLYPSDSMPELVIYDQGLREQSRLPWYSIVPKDTLTDYQTIIINNRLAILIEQKTAAGIQIRCINVDENGKRLNERTLVTDTTLKDFRLNQYAAEVSKNGKYILLYCGITTSSDDFQFRGFLFDNNWNSIKQFVFPVKKQETEDSWSGAMVDIEGNIHSLVFSAADSWRKGTKIQIHTIVSGTDEMKSEQVEVGNRRLINYVFREDTLLHAIQLKATSTWQHRKDAMAGIAYMSFPLQRNGKIRYASYDFSSEEKKSFTKNITAQNNLLNSSMIEFPWSFSPGGPFYTSLLIQSDYPGSAKIKPVSDNRAVSKLNEFYMPDKAINRSSGNVPYYAAPNQNSDRKQQDEINRLTKIKSWQNTKNISREVRQIILKTTTQGTLETVTERVFKKGLLPFYDASFYTVKDNSLQMLTYIVNTRGPALYLLTDNNNVGMKEIKTPDNVFVLLNEGRMLTDNTCLLPYLNSKTGGYGMVTIVF